MVGSNRRKRKLVAAGVVVNSSGQVLITRRRADQSQPLLWEFPGGKVEIGESPTAALVRELREEVALETQVGRIWDVLYHPYDEFDLVMLVYACRHAGGTGRCRQVSDLAWCATSELGRYSMVPADRPLVERLQREGPPTPPAP